MADPLGTAMRFSMGTRKVMPSFVGDALRLGPSWPREGAAQRILANAGERRARQRADRIESEFPQSFNQISARMSPSTGALQAASDEAFRHALDALAGSFRPVRRPGSDFPRRA
jgi:hypothetical protein